MPPADEAGATLEAVKQIAYSNCAVGVFARPVGLSEEVRRALASAPSTKVILEEARSEQPPQPNPHCSPVPPTPQIVHLEASAQLAAVLACACRGWRAEADAATSPAARRAAAGAAAEAARVLEEMHADALEVAPMAEFGHRFRRGGPACEHSLALYLLLRANPGYLAAAEDNLAMLLKHMRASRGERV